MIIKEEGYSPVECDEPLPCPFCGGKAKLVQLSHTIRYQKQGRKSVPVRICVLASNYELTGDTFWFKCTDCACTTGNHKDTAQEAATAWNMRTSA